MEAISIFGIKITDNLLDKSSIKGNAKMNKNEREELGEKKWHYQTGNHFSL